MKPLLQTAIIYLAWVLLHYFAAHLYIYYCVPDTLTGFLYSPFLIPTPHCSLLRWAVYQGGETIHLMWLCLSVVVVKMLTPR